MNKQNKPIETRVVQVTTTPKEFRSMIGAITTQESAKSWGERMGYPLVYWHKRLQRVYGAKGGLVS